MHFFGNDLKVTELQPFKITPQQRSLYTAVACS